MTCSRISILLLALSACEAPVCDAWGTRHVDAYTETEPRVYMCPIYKCGAKETQHPAHDEQACIHLKGDK